MNNNPRLIAPCGMDCSHCSAYLNHLYGQAGKVTISCAGCRPRNKKCAHIIKRCERLLNHEVDFCFECESFPCEHLERLEARYVKNGYANSFIDNNKRIKEIGEEAFQAEQNERFTCPDCGGPISIHEGRCYRCGKIQT